MVQVPAHTAIELNDTDFGKISRLIYDQCGIHLNEGKKELVKARLEKRVRKGGFKSFRDYYDYVLQDPSGQEMICLLDSISTNFTGFFREKKHFDALQSDILPDLMARKKGRTNRLRFWSAACSSGEEVYSIAMTLLEAITNLQEWDLLILATDISTKVLKTAASGIYPCERVQAIPAALLRKYFLKGEGCWRDHVKVKDSVKRYIRFERLNLIEPFPFEDPFDCIFLRNVMIYFDKKTQTDLVNRFHACLGKDGYLIVGHSESLTGIEHSFKYVSPTIYRKQR